MPPGMTRDVSASVASMASCYPVARKVKPRAAIFFCVR